jgi:hypothetical protein
MDERVAFFRFEDEQTHRQGRAGRGPEGATVRFVARA